MDAFGNPCDFFSPGYEDCVDECVRNWIDQSIQEGGITNTPVDINNPICPAMFEFTSIPGSANSIRTAGISNLEMELNINGVVTRFTFPYI
jgi:hypothetical protein